MTAVPECDCYTTHRGPRLHRRGCPRILAILKKYRPKDARAPKGRDNAGR